MPNARIAAIRAPTLVIHAADDKLQLFHNAEYAASTIPGARLARFEKGGHLLVSVEQAAEIYEMRLLLDPVAIEQSVRAAVEGTVAAYGRLDAAFNAAGIDGDIGKTMGRLLREELDMPGPLVSIDGVQLQELDFVDVGELINPPGVVPVVIKSLLFS